MTDLNRFVPTRLLEAAHREAVACFARPLVDTRTGKTLAELYGDRITALHSLTDQGIVPHQIEVSIEPVTYEQGVSDLARLDYNVIFSFYYPLNILDHIPTRNSLWDHPYTLRAWLFTGGTWEERIGGAYRTPGAIEDPDEANKPLATLRAIRISNVQPGTTTPQQDLIATYETRENSRGGRQ